MLAHFCMHQIVGPVERFDKYRIDLAVSGFQSRRNVYVMDVIRLRNSAREITGL